MAKKTPITDLIKPSIVQPQVKVEGETHFLEEILEGDFENVPELKSVGYAKLSQSASGWVSYVITTRGKEVLSIEVSEPDQRAIAEDMAKIEFVKTFVDQGLT